MTRYSLRLRLLVGAVVAVSVSLGIAYLAMTALFQRQLEQRVELELRRLALQLVAGVSVDAMGAISEANAPSDPRFDAPASGLYWQISNAAGTLRSRSLWDQVLEPSPNVDLNEWTRRVTDGPFEQRLFMIERIIQPTGSNANVVVQLALNDAELSTSREEFARVVAMLLLVLGIALAAAAWVQVYLGLRPLGALKSDLAALRRNASKRLVSNYPREVEPLTQAINELADAREGDVKRARQRAADLAHGLKTPIAALAAQSRLIREGISDSAPWADGLDRAIAAAAAAVEAELARARAAASRHADAEATAKPLTVAQGLVLVLERTEKGMRVDYYLDIPDTLRISMTDEDLSEILGPLLENAVRYARRKIRVASEEGPDSVGLSVEDDGPGIGAADLAAVMVRGVRLDQAEGGHGLGLAIARDLTEATGGTIALGVSNLGGLKVNLRWPAIEREAIPSTRSRSEIAT